jgi:DNA-binding SARP family transcriptional activator
MEYRILGPLEVHGDVGRLALGGQRHQKVLAVLLLNANSVVPLSRLIDAVWGDAPPATARQQIQNRVSALRRTLTAAGAPDVIATDGPGYVLRVDEGQLDASAFEAQVGRAETSASAGDLGDAVDQLRGALALWRGPALAGLAGGPVEATATRLNERRLSTLETCCEHELALGRHLEIAAELTQWHDEYPLRERLAGQLMLTLYRCGRHSEALAVYQRLRARLAEELGVDPVPELTMFHQAILRHDPALQAPGDRTGTASQPRESAATTRSGVVPTAQLPPDVAAFTGRTEYLGQLDALLEESDHRPPAARVAVIAGMAGVGKTTLAVHWAHRVRHRFPDGQLHINLQGFAPCPPMRPIDPLTRFLHALGVWHEQIPADPDEAAGMYRSLLADKRVLIVLDDAADADQVRRLLPASPDCLVLVTSRNRLTGLVARDGARRIDLGLLSADEAGILLARVIDADRVRAEPDACAELARTCAYLPLALRIAAAHLAEQPHRTVSQYLAQLTTGDPLSALSVVDDDQAAVRAAFDLSYRHLPADVRRVFRLLGLVPGSDVAADAAAALVDGGIDATMLTLHRLAAVHLLEQSAPDRYRFHDLLRRYAIQRAESEDSETDRRAAVERLLHYYLRTADGGTRLLYPQVVRLPPAAGAASGSTRHADRAASLAWLDAERANLVAATRHAAAQGPRHVAWLLADALRGYFARHTHIVDWLATAHAAAAAAEADDDPTGMAGAQLNLADALRRLSRYEQAIVHYNRALVLSRQVGWLDGQATALANLSGAYLLLGRQSQAAHHLNQALQIDRRTGRRSGEASRLNNLGVVYWQMGRLERSAEHYRAALSIRLASGPEVDQATNRSNLAEVYHALGRLGRARDHIERSLELHRQRGNQGDADAMRVMAVLCRDAGQYAEAVEYAQAAVALSDGDTDRDPRTHVHALVTLGTIRHHLGQYRMAIDLHGRALRVALETGNRFPQAEALIGLAAAHLDNDQPGQAACHAGEAFAIARDTGFRGLEGHALTVLAQISLYHHRHAEAVARASCSFAIQRETGHRLGEARTLLVLGRAQCACGDLRAARAHGEWARRIFEEVGTPEADDARVLLSTWAAGKPPEQAAFRAGSARALRP